MCTRITYVTKHVTYRNNILFISLALWYDRAMQKHVPESLSLSRKILFALGQLGWSLASYAPGMLLVYFYMPAFVTHK